MSFSYSGDPSKSAKDRVRWELGDTASRSALQTDEEIQAAIALEASVEGAIARCADAIATKFRRQVNIKVGPMAYDYSRRAEHWDAVRDYFRQQAEAGSLSIPGGPDYDPTKPYDPKRSGGYFRAGMHDRPDNKNG